MATQERRESILQLAMQQGQVQVEQLVTRFGVSEVTIRKDLTALEQRGQLVRCYGGAKLLPETENAPHFSPSQQRIAKAAAALVGTNQRVIIDSGSTTAALISALEPKKGLVVMTNSLDVANQIRTLSNEPTLLMTGGTWDVRSDSFQGVIAEQAIRSYDFDWLFTGADGIDERGTTTFNEVVGLTQVMASAAQKVVVLVQAQKFGRKMPNLELNWQQIDIVITDSDVPAKVRSAIEQHSVQLIIAN
ncbi:DeoR/GlpR transcriptional regulator [Pasteurellaceae bacterium HPA106]|uniref:DeoR/GlpR family DNA-binding transcription regulator n=1 Tax=Spirabiliibacterium pneumoniae TaxID=221400 RepID=UPI001AAC6667|nr:DeoR/GlpR family DNA-binding transcription regulator [Spirabiliibacterium pneumoniae]MBE2896245.1 DeoR/GlpR transcriptional regulator [Spirabiliibacterium pneumoniae]